MLQDAGLSTDTAVLKLPLRLKFSLRVSFLIAVAVALVLVLVLLLVVVVLVVVVIFLLAYLSTIMCGRKHANTFEQECISLVVLPHFYSLEQFTFVFTSMSKPLALLHE